MGAARVRRVVRAMVIVSIASCGSDGDESPLDAGSPADASQDSSPGASATWDSLYRTVFSQSCARPGCHTAGGRGGLSFDDPAEAYLQLVGDGEGGPSIGPECAGKGHRLVVPGDPEGSLLMRKITGTQECGGPMTFVSDESLALIRQWISEGAE